MTAAFDRASYTSGEIVSITLRAHNAGSTPITDLAARQDHGSTQIVLNNDTGFGKFAHIGAIAAGGTLTDTVYGSPASATATSVVLSGDLVDAHGAAVVHFSATAAITAVKTVPVRGLIYVDANHNNHADAGEGRAGINVTLTHVFNSGDSQDYPATTNAAGRFTVMMPAGPAALHGSGGGLEVVPQFPTISADGADLVARAVRPLGHELSASITFDRSSYNVGDTVHVTITLRNSGPETLSGIVADCQLDRESLIDEHTVWGRFFSTGVTIPAHRTRVFAETATVPSSAATYGVTSVSCTFGYRGIYDGYRPQAGATAKVPATTTSSPAPSRTRSDPAPTHRTSTGALANTGSDVGSQAAAGGAAVGAGLLLCVGARRRRAR